MMNKLSVIFIVIAGAATVGCSGIKRKPGDIYMPDMAYSRAYETYIERDSTVFTDDPGSKEDEIFYNNRPVPGTVFQRRRYKLYYYQRIKPVIAQIM